MTGSTPIFMRPPPPALRPAKPAEPPLSVMDHIGYVVLCLFLFLMFGRPADFAFSYLHLPLISSSLSLIIAILSGGVLLVLRSRLGLLITLLTAWFILAIPFSTFRGGSFAAITSNWFRAYLCFVLIVSICKRPTQIRKIMRILAWSLLLTALLALQFGAITSGRLHLPAGLLTGPNELAGAIIVGILYWLFNLFDPSASPFYRAFSAIATLPMLLVLLRTGSRGSMLTLAVVLVLLFFGLSAGKKVIVAFSAVIIVLLSFLVLPGELRRRYTTYFTSSSTAENPTDVDSPVGSTEHRLYLLQRSIEFTLTHPIFGVGPDQFATYEDAAAREDGHLKGSWLGCHNTYTQISSESGIPGLIIFVMILITAWKATGRVYRDASRLGNSYGAGIATTAQALRYVLLAYVVFFLFEHTAYMPFWPTLIGLIAALDMSFPSPSPAIEPRRQPATTATQRPAAISPAIARASLRPGQG